MSSAILNKIFSACILPHFDYACSIWGNSSKFNLVKLQRLQNRAASIVSKNYDYINVRGHDLVKQLKWMDVNQRIHFVIATLMFKCIHGNAPYYLQNKITMLQDINKYQTRSTTNYNVLIPSIRTSLYKQSFSFNGPFVWNNLPNHLKQSVSLSSFKYNYKKHFLPNHWCFYSFYHAHPMQTYYFIPATCILCQVYSCKDSCFYHLIVIYCSYVYM